MLLLAQPRGNNADVRLRLLHGHARLQPRQKVVVFVTVIQFLLRVHRQRHKNLRLIDAADHGYHFMAQLELLRQDADYGTRLSVERNASPQQIWVAAEGTLPQSVRQHYRIRLARPVFVRGKDAAQQRLHAEHGQQARRRLDAIHPHRLRKPAQRIAFADRDRRLLEDVVLRLDVVILPR